jgi:hypothetical protein
MQMPQMAKDVFMRGFIAPAGVAVKPLVWTKQADCLDKTVVPASAQRFETFY